MKTNKYLFFLFIALTIALSSCKKDDENSSDFRLIGTWTENPSIEQFIYVFNSNGQGTFKVKNCDTSEILENETFTYSFDSKTTKITLSSGGETDNAYIKFISKTSIQFYSDAAYTDEASEIFYKQ